MEDGDSYDHLAKLLLVGSSGVGKSSVLTRFASGSFSVKIQPTIGVDFKIKTTEYKGRRVKITIWDTAGQEKYRTLTSSYYRGAHGVFIVFDVTDRDSYELADTWLSEIAQFCPDGARSVVKILVGNKIDSPRRQVTFDEADAYAQRKDMLYAEVSAFDGQGIDQLFQIMVSAIIDNPALNQATAARSEMQPVQLSSSSGGPIGSTCCRTT